MHTLFQNRRNFLKKLGALSALGLLSPGRLFLGKASVQVANAGVRLVRNPQSVARTVFK